MDYSGLKQAPKRSMSILVTTVLIALLSVTSGHTAGPDSANSSDIIQDSFLDLEKMINAALIHSDQVASRHSQWEASVENSSQAGYFPDPTLSYGYFAEEIQTRTGAQTQRFSVSQAIPSWGKRGLRRQYAHYNEEAAYQDYRSSQLGIVREIRLNFYEYAWLREALEIAKQHLELLTVMESVASIRFSSGALNQSALIQIQIELGVQEDRIRELRAQRQPISSRLCALLSRPVEILPWPDSASIKIPVIPSDFPEQGVTDRNPDLKKIAIYSEQEKVNQSLVRKDYYPDLTAGLDYISVAGGADPVMARISIHLPIWRSRLKSAERESVLRQTGFQAAYQNYQNTLKADIDYLVFQFNDAVRKSDLYANTLIPRAEQAIDIALKEFETGGITYGDLIEMEREYLEFQLTGIRQVMNANRNWAEIIALSGYELIKPEHIEG